MDELDQDAKALIEAFRGRRRNPSAQQTARGWAAVEAGLAGGAGLGIEAATEGLAGGSGPAVAGEAVASVAATKTGLAASIKIFALTVTIGSGAVLVARQVTAPEPTPTSEARQIAPVEVEADPPNQRPPGPVVASDPEPEPEPDAVDEAPPAPQASPSRPKTSESSPAVAGSDALQREVALMQEARTAMRAGEFARALALLETHARDFERGVMSLDRKAWTAIISCRRGDLQEGTRRATEFIERNPKSPHVEDLRRACELVEQSGEKNNDGSP